MDALATYLPKAEGMSERVSDGVGQDGALLSFFSGAANQLLDDRAALRREVARVLPALLSLVAEERVANSAVGAAVQTFIDRMTASARKASATTGIVKCGFLLKWRPTGISTQKRWVVLDGTHLMYFRSRDETDLRGVVQLRGAVVSQPKRLFASAATSFEIHLVTEAELGAAAAKRGASSAVTVPGERAAIATDGGGGTTAGAAGGSATALNPLNSNKRSYTFTCASKAECDAWVSAIRSAIASAAAEAEAAAWASRLEAAPTFHAYVAHVARIAARGTGRPLRLSADWVRVHMAAAKRALPGIDSVLQHAGSGAGFGSMGMGMGMSLGSHDGSTSGSSALVTLPVDSAVSSSASAAAASSVAAAQGIGAGAAAQSVMLTASSPLNKRLARVLSRRKADAAEMSSKASVAVAGSTAESLAAAASGPGAGAGPAASAASGLRASSGFGAGIIATLSPLAAARAAAASAASAALASSGSAGSTGSSAAAAAHARPAEGDGDAAETGEHDAHDDAALSRPLLAATGGSINGDGDTSSAASLASVAAGDSPAGSAVGHGRSSWTPLLNGATGGAAGSTGAAASAGSEPSPTAASSAAVGLALPPMSPADRKAAALVSRAHVAAQLRDEAHSVVAAAEASSHRRRAGYTFGDRVSVRQLGRDSTRDVVSLDGAPMVNCDALELVTALMCRIVAVANACFNAYWRHKHGLASSSDAPTHLLLSSPREAPLASCNSRLPGFEQQLLEFAREVLLCSSRTVTGGDTFDATEAVFRNPARVLFRPDTDGPIDPVVMRVAVLGKPAAAWGDAVGLASGSSSAAGGAGAGFRGHGFSGGSSSSSLDFDAGADGIDVSEFDSPSATPAAAPAPTPAPASAASGDAASGSGSYIPPSPSPSPAGAAFALVSEPLASASASASAPASEPLPELFSDDSDSDGGADSGVESGRERTSLVSAGGSGVAAPATGAGPTGVLSTPPRHTPRPPPPRDGKGQGRVSSAAADAPPTPLSPGGAGVDATATSGAPLGEAIANHYAALAATSATAAASAAAAAVTGVAAVSRKRSNGASASAAVDATTAAGTAAAFASAAPSCAADMLPLLSLRVHTRMRYRLVSLDEVEEDALAAARATIRIAASSAAAAAAAAGGASSSAAAAAAPLARSVYVPRPQPHCSDVCMIYARFGRTFPWEGAAPSATVHIVVQPYETA